MRARCILVICQIHAFPVYAHFQALISSLSAGLTTKYLFELAKSIQHRSCFVCLSALMRQMVFVGHRSLDLG